MDFNSTKDDLLKRIQELENESQNKLRYEKINQTLFKISNSINTTSSLPELYESIHKSLSSIIDTTNFFIARYDTETDSVVFPHCVDEIDGQLPPVEKFTTTASLTAEVVRTGKSILIDKEATIKFRIESGFPIPGCTPSEQWLGAPLKIEGTIIGVIAMQSYTNKSLYDETDKDVIVAVADQVALAIDRKSSEEKRESLIKELHTALEEVKTLQGILPICSQCKKIRDDKGSWNQIEMYIQHHSDAMFSHGICPTCTKELYGDEDWYEEETS